MNPDPENDSPQGLAWDQARWQRTLTLPGAQLGLDPEFTALRPQLYVHWFPCLPSTNDTLWELIKAGSGSGTVAIAAQQTTGRGQQGRTWMSPLGGLYLSLGLALPEADSTHFTWPNPWPLLTLATAWGIATTLSRLGLPVGIKWPNDLVYPGRCNGCQDDHRSSPDVHHDRPVSTPAQDFSARALTLKKLGGILAEIRCPQPGNPWAVIGVGLNWQNPVPPTGQALWPLRPHPLPPDYPLDCLEDLAAIVLRAMIQGYYGWQRWQTPILLQHYQSHLITLGQRVLLDNGHWGIVTGLSSEGALQVTSPTGHQTFHPGQIHLGYGSPPHQQGELDRP